jgi:hypothetical protein
MGNFESFKFDVFVSIPCYVEEVVDAYRQVTSLVDEMLNAEWEAFQKRGMKQEGTNGQT